MKGGEDMKIVNPMGRTPNTLESSVDYARAGCICSTGSVDTMNNSFNPNPCKHNCQIGNYWNNVLNYEKAEKN